MPQFFILRFFSFLLAVILLLQLFFITGCVSRREEPALTHRQAIYENQPPDVNHRVLEQLEIVSVSFVNEKGQISKGQIVVHNALVQDVREVFNLILKTEFPVARVLPIAHPWIQKKGPYGISPETDNTSAFVWRPGVGLNKLSMHALGMAIDINPHLNPYIKDDLVLPPGSVYCPHRPGTLTPDSEVVLLFKRLGWTWGGDWANLGKMDYMHFEKIPPGWEMWVKELRK